MIFFNAELEIPLQFHNYIFYIFKTKQLRSFGNLGIGISIANISFLSHKMFYEKVGH